MSDRHLSPEEIEGDLAGAGADHVRTCAACAQRRSALQLVHAGIASLGREAPPPAAAVALLGAAQRISRRRAWLAGGVVALSLFALATVAAVLMARRSGSPLSVSLLDEIALDHLHYVHLDSASQFSGRASDIATWFRPTLGRVPRLADVEALSFRGARNCRLAGQRVALVFVERAGHRLSLFVMPRVSSRGAGCAESQRMRVCSIPDPQGGTRALVGDLAAREMLRLLAESTR